MNARTTVANVRDGRDAWQVYVGRRMPGHVGLTGPTDGLFGNPYPVAVYGPQAGPLFVAYFLGRVDTDPAFRARVEQLRGLVLGCWCHPNPCHAHVIAAWLNGDLELLAARRHPSAWARPTQKSARMTGQRDLFAAVPPAEKTKETKRIAFDSFSEVQMPDVSPKHGDAVAILIRSKLGQVALVGRRNDPEAWCLPGGMVEAGETPLQAAAREATEELGFDVPVSELSQHWQGPRPDGQGLVTFFRCAWRPVDTPLVQQAGEPPCRWGGWHELFVPTCPFAGIYLKVLGPLGAFP